MSTSSRFRKAINAYIKNDAKAAAIASLLTSKDCSQHDLVNTDGFNDSAVTLLPLLSSEIGETEINSSVSKYFTQATKGKILFIICGFSASGKDTLASYAKHTLYMEGKEFSYTRKYTTRARRGFEGGNQSGSRSEPSGNYEYFNDIKDINNISDAVLNYTLYGHKYAFSGEHIESCSTDDKYQMCIYGKLENIHEVRRKVFLEHKRLPFTILINSSTEDCESRIIRRHSMTDNEQLTRIREMKRQAIFLAKNTDFVNTAFDLTIYNSDTSTVAANSKKLSDFISNKIAWANKTMHTAS